ncbi:MAG: TonB-dependent receptor [Bacteroidota bacterium]
MKKWSVALVSMLLFSSVLHAGITGKIAGTVRDKKTNEGIPSANVMIKGTSLGATTDESGEYFILNVPPGVYSVTASVLGYGKLTQTDVAVRTDQTTALDFELSEEMLTTEGLVITAVKPKVELDLTASKETISRDEIVNTWAKDIKDIARDILGANINGGIRGSYGGDASFRMDGIDLRDVASNTNFSSVNMSTVQEVEVLTGGWNAEYGQANGSIVNIVTRRATDRIHATATYKERPAGKYHWGRNIFDENDVFHTVMTTPEYWDTSKTWRTPWMTPGEAQKGNLGDGKFASMTPQQKADWWKQFVNDKNRFPQMDYTKRAEWEGELTLYGPMSENMNFLFSGRFKEGVNIYPSALKYNPDMTYQGSLEWIPLGSTTISLSGMFTKFVNTGDPRTTYQSSETNPSDIASQSLSYISDPYDNFKFWLWGVAPNGGSAGDGSSMRPPEYAQMLNVQAKLTQVFSNRTFLNVALQHTQMDYHLDFREVAQTANFRSYGLPLPTDSVEAYGIMLPSFAKPPSSLLFNASRWGSAGDIWRSESQTRTQSLKADLTSQIARNHLIKTGLMFSLNEIHTLTHEGNMTSTTFVQVNDIVPIVHRPYEGAVYAQDKVEVGGMVLNAGVRLDFFNANETVSSDFFDPLMLSEYTVGNSGRTGLVGFRQDGSGPGYARTKLRWAFSPRLGISHPITETTVLHFMFGVFNQRPAWVKILANPVVWSDTSATGNLGDLVRAGLITSDYNLPDTLLVTYRYYGAKVGNPGLTWERMTQYEVGIVQNIADVFSLDVVMYYKSAKDLTSLGIDQGGEGNASVIKTTGGNVDVQLYGDPLVANTRIPGVYIGNFMTTVNGAWAEVRGLEATLRSQMDWLNLDLGYTLSYLTSGRYYANGIFKPSAVSGVPLAENRYSGPNNTDGGGIGTDDDLWNPTNSALLKLTVKSPSTFGPTLGGVHGLGDWMVSVSTRWAQGSQFTWYATDYTGTQYPNNQRWKDRWNTNLNLTRNIHLNDNVTLKLFIQVTNLFDNRHLRLLTGSDLDNYMTYGTLPFNKNTKEPTEWNWYTNNPRQIYFGTTVEF